MNYQGFRRLTFPAVLALSAQLYAYTPGTPSQANISNPPLQSQSRPQREDITIRYKGENEKCYDVKRSNPRRTKPDTFCSDKSNGMLKSVETEVYYTPWRSMANFTFNLTDGAVYLRQTDERNEVAMGVPRLSREGTILTHDFVAIRILTGELDGTLKDLLENSERDKK